MMMMMERIIYPSYKNGVFQYILVTDQRRKYRYNIPVVHDVAIRKEIDLHYTFVVDFVCRMYGGWWNQFWEMCVEG